MKILAITSEAYGGFGGVATYNVDLFNALSELEYVESIDLVSRVVRGSLSGLPQKVVFHGRKGSSILFFFTQIIKLIRRRDFDVIICAHVNLLPFARLVQVFKRTPIITIIYGTEAWKPTKRFMTDKVLAESDAIVSISDFTAEQFSAWSGVSLKEIHLLPNAYHAGNLGVGKSPQYLFERHNIKDRKVILSLGRLDARERQKGMDELIQAMPTLLQKDPNFVLIIAGDGDDRSRLESKAAELGLHENIIFAGKVSEVEKADYYRMADVFSMAGRQEGFGFVFIEALACGTPVVGSQKDGSRYALLHGELGELVDPSDTNSLVEALMKASEKPRIIPKRLSFFSYKNFVKRLDIIMKPYLKSGGGG